MNAVFNYHSIHGNFYWYEFHVNEGRLYKKQYNQQVYEIQLVPTKIEVKAEKKENCAKINFDLEVQNDVAVILN